MIYILYLYYIFILYIYIIYLYTDIYTHVYNVYTLNDMDINALWSSILTHKTQQQF